MLGADSRGSLPRFHCRDWVESGYRHVRVVDADELAAYVDAGADGASEDLTIRAPAQPLRRVLRTSPLPRTGAWIENPQRHSLLIGNLFVSPRIRLSRTPRTRHLQSGGTVPFGFRTLQLWCPAIVGIYVKGPSSYVQVT